MRPPSPRRPLRHPRGSVAKNTERGFGRFPRLKRLLRGGCGSSSRPWAGSRSTIRTRRPGPRSVPPCTKRHSRVCRDGIPCIVWSLRPWHHDPRTRLPHAGAVSTRRVIRLKRARPSVGSNGGHTSWVHAHRMTPASRSRRRVRHLSLGRRSVDAPTAALDAAYKSPRRFPKDTRNPVLGEELSGGAGAGCGAAGAM